VFGCFGSAGLAALRSQKLRDVFQHASRRRTAGRILVLANQRDMAEIEFIRKLHH
jgi:hypothetical protein